eukprot:scaffold5567_cov169-Amphora_coffeaeformis.AAC.2
MKRHTGNKDRRRLSGVGSEIRTQHSSQRPNIKPEGRALVSVSHSSDSLAKECTILFDSMRQEIEAYEKKYIETENALMAVYMTVFRRLEAAKEHQQLLLQRQQQHIHDEYHSKRKAEGIWIDYALGLMDVISDLGNNRSRRHNTMQRERENLVESQCTQVISVIAGENHSSCSTVICLAKDQQAEQRRINEGEMKTFKKEQQLVVHALDTIRRTLLSKVLENTDKLVELGCNLKITKTMGDEKVSEYSMRRERASHHFSFLLQMMRDISVVPVHFGLPDNVDGGAAADKENSKSRNTSLSSNNKKKGVNPRMQPQCNISELLQNASCQQRTKATTTDVESHIDHQAKQDDAPVGNSSRESGKESIQKVPTGSSRGEKKQEYPLSRASHIYRRSPDEEICTFGSVENVKSNETRLSTHSVFIQTHKSRPDGEIRALGSVENVRPNESKLSAQSTVIQKHKNLLDDDGSMKHSVKTESIEKNKSVCRTFAWMWGVHD